MTFSEERLGLPTLWFTGQEWASGEAERVLIEQYEDASERELEIERTKTPAQKRKDESARKRKRFQKWFAWSLTQEKP